LTRQCNIKCGYCKLAEKQFERELTVDEWKKAFLLLEKIGIKTIKLMGGEPTVIDGLEEILVHISKHTNIKYALLSNSVISNEKLDSLVKAGLQGYFASVNTLENFKGKCSDGAEEKNGFDVLKILKNKGVKLLGANVVITAKNLHDIIEIVSTLSNEGIWVNLCPVIHDRQKIVKSDWEYRKVVDESSLLKEEDIPILNNFMIKLLQLKQEGLRLAVPDNYLIDMTKFGIDCSWQCSHFSQLRIDADGALMLCNDIRGSVSEKYNITTLTENGYRDFQNDWQKERQSLDCPGCYWSCFYFAEENLKNNRNEFYYVGGSAK
jgi:molybdenum cofactor biosynthesis enzyme MoaA